MRKSGLRGEQVWLRSRRLRNFRANEQARLFQQTAEIFLAGDVLRACFAGKTGQGFVFDFKAFQPHDTDIFAALFPNLSLLQFHRCGGGIDLSLLMFASGETATAGRLLLLAGGLFVRDGLAFLLVGGAGFGLFL
jgi:hypothetical protein